MSLFPIALDGKSISVVVVGGGEVGTRKALALAAAGAHVRVVSPEFTPELRRAANERSVTLERGAYSATALRQEHLVIAATGSSETNRLVAADALRQAKLVNVVDAPAEGNFQTMATHRSGDVTIAVSAGGVPVAARRIRDEIAVRFDDRYARAVSALGALRSRLLKAGGSAWTDASSVLIAEDFCASVENGSVEGRVSKWV